ncbi:MAG: phosphoglucosamine mutase, partial [Firmicutes bacterium]|nr:phosphoglucosamine mutase [Bacillota bacterium]
EKGSVIDGDRVIAICARILKEQGRLKENKVTVTVMSNIGFHKAMKESDIEVDVTGVGDRYVLERMLETGCVIGGEQSGHIIFKEFTTTGDGVLSSLQFVGAIRNSNKTLSEMAAEIEIFPQVLVNARINNDYKKTYMKDEEVAAMIADIEAEMAGNGRVLIRPSGTEPLVRVMIEGDDEQQLNDLAHKLADLIERKFK